jgi:hypothetical protein
MRATLTELPTFVYAHLLTNGAHGIAHLLAGIGVTTFQILFVLIDIMALPLLGLRIFKNEQRTGALVCLAAIFASGMFGTYYHYIYVSRDHVSQIPFTVAGILYMMTAFLISFVDGVTSYIIYKMLFLDKNE